MAFNVGTLIGYMQLEGGAVFNRGVASAKGEMRSAAATAEALNVSVSGMERNLVGAGRQAAVASSGTAKFRAAQLSAVAATERYNAVLASENATTRQLAMSEAALIRANEAVKRSTPAAALASVNREAAFASSSVGKTGAAFVGAARSAVGLGAAFGAFELAKKAIEFASAGKELTTALNGVQAASHATDTQMRAVRAQAIAMGKDLTIPAATAVDAAQAIEDLVRAGMKLPRALQAARPALLLASAAQTDVATTAKILGDVLDDFRLPAQEAAHVANSLAGAATASSGGLIEMFEAIKFAGPVARAAGVDVDTLIASVAELAKTGTIGTLAGTGLRSMLLSLAGPTKLQTEGMKALNVEAWDTHGRFVGLPTLFDQLHAAQKRLTQEDFLGYVRKAFGKPAATVITSFAHDGGKALDEFLKRVKSGDVQQFANLMNRGVTADLAQLKKEFTAVGIDAFQSLEPPLVSLVGTVGHELPVALHLAGAALSPFASAWHLAGDAVGPVGTAIGVVADVLEPVAPLLKGAGVAALSMWVAFKVGTVSINLVRDAVNATGVAVRNRAADFQVWRSELNATAEQSAATAAVMEADALAIGVAYAEEAAAIDRAAMQEAVAFAAMIERSEASSAAQIAAANAAADAAVVQARRSQVAAAQTAAAAEEASVAVKSAGAGARAGWASLAGPIGIAAVGVFALVSMFHSSTAASKEAADAAKAYGDALKDGGDKTTILDTITEQLKKNNVPAEIETINKALGRAAFHGQDFTNAIMGGVPAMVALEQRLIAVQRAGTFQTGAKGSLGTFVKQLTPEAIAAGKLLRSLSDEYYGLTKATKKDLLDTKTFAGASSSLDKAAQKYGVVTGTAKTYAAMVGILGDKNGVTTLTQEELNRAVGGVQTAFEKATGAGSEYLKAVQTFSTSTGAASDRAALIGSTLKAANGDALSYAAAMISAASANDALVAGFTGDREKIAGFKQQLSDLNSQLSKLGKDPNNERSGIVAQIADVEKQLADAYKTAEKSAINLNTGAIDFSKGGAPALVSQLQAIQDAAVKAAGATYQHEVATKGAKKAAEDAYQLYVNQTSGALHDEAKQLGLNNTQADKLGKTYFGMPKEVKTLIQQEGADPVLNVLTRIGILLAKFTRQPWDIKVDADTTAVAAKLRDLNKILGTLPGGSNTAAGNNKLIGLLGARADGGPVKAGVPYIVGEKRPEVFVPDTNGRIEPRVPASGGRTVIVQQTINNPVPEPASVSGPKGLERAANRIGGL